MNITISYPVFVHDLQQWIVQERLGESLVRSYPISDYDTGISFREGLIARRAKEARELKAKGLNALIDEYTTWNAAQGLNLGSADEHIFDETLTNEQRKWLRNFVWRWSIVEHPEE